ncbi:hypothetical protein Hypma_007299 [Hypsizygus marmoreus]|uniref:Uncharacterized protein n=1 Tax=Hypsizygus marmoreus TaxID=39966 RepID=A0A369KCT3_HYPMA|nr:hypothetical protein Hypma_007299 [Hypsizygus marmoreus]
MNPKVSSFFSRDVFLKRQARTHKRPANAKLCPSSSSNKPLPMIMEEDEPRSSSSSSRSPSPMAPCSSSSGASNTKVRGVKSKRRHANLSVSDIRVARAALVHDDNDISQHNPALLSSPRPAPRPPASPTSSPEPSPDPFSLKFSDGSLKFPHPPIPTPSSISTFDHFRLECESPTPSMSSSSASTSPESHSSGLPLTPSSSDDEFPSYYSSPLPSFNPRRVSIKPLVINKLNSSLTPDDSPCVVSTLRQSFKKVQEDYSLLTPSSPISSDGNLASDSEESDSEWYNREFSKILTLCSPLPPNFPEMARPESMCVPDSAPSQAFPTSPTTQGCPSAQLDPAFPRRRRSRISIPKYPPPPVPSVPAHLRSPSASSIPIGSPVPSTPTKPRSRPSSGVLFIAPPLVRRPPPRSSIPADCILVDETFAFSDDSGSAFSFSLYDDLPSTTSHEAESPKSFYSQPSFQSPTPSPFPSSFPSTPSSFPSEEFDFPVDEVEFEMDLDRSMMLPLSLPNSPIDLEADIASGLEELRLSSPTQVAPKYPSIDLSDADTFTTSADPGSSSGDCDESRMLRSKWSSSTLSSIREEHAQRSGFGASAKLRSYFGSPSPRSRRATAGSSRKSGTPTTPLTPTSPAKRFRHARRESDVMVIGYGQPQGRELRRRGSVTPSVSDAGSEESASSTSSSGLRRKPIPVEMFLRSAA